MGKIIHGLSVGKPRLYNIWVNMKARCNNKNGRDYHKYGGRGIRVCEEWQKSYIAFYNWAMENNYDDTLTLDRIDNNKNYSPDNCRWATVKQQNNNQRTNINIEYQGVTRTLKEWSEIMNIKYSTLYKRYKSGWEIEKIFKKE